MVTKKVFFITIQQKKIICSICFSKCQYFAYCLSVLDGQNSLSVHMRIGPPRSGPVIAQSNLQLDSFHFLLQFLFLRLGAGSRGTGGKGEIIEAMGFAAWRSG